MENFNHIKSIMEEKIGKLTKVICSYPNNIPCISIPGELVSIDMYKEKYSFTIIISDFEGSRTIVFDNYWNLESDKLHTYNLMDHFLLSSYKYR